MTSLLLLHTKDVNKEKQIIELCRKLNIRTRIIKPSDVNVTLGVLSGNVRNTDKVMNNKSEKKAPLGFELPETMVFTGFPEKLLDSFLEEYKTAGIQPISLKAIATFHNIHWTVYELVEELARERAAMMFGNKK